MTKTQTKHCTKCDQDKGLSEFSKRRSSKDGLQSQCRACGRAYQEANREKIRAKKKAYREANREKFLAYNREYRPHRRANDSIYRQIDNTRRNLRNILHGKNSHQPTLDLLGCTGQEWRDHLESLWTKGMSWDNYGYGEGKWQCDHIIPVSSFDQTKTDERKICWNYLNTQPLWTKDNLAKGSTIPKESTTNQ